MGLSRLSEKCRKCKYVDTCNNKRMEALAYLGEETKVAGIDAAGPIINLHDIKINTNMTAAIEKKVIEKLTDNVNASFNIWISTYR